MFSGLVRLSVAKQTHIKKVTDKKLETTDYEGILYIKFMTNDIRKAHNEIIYHLKFSLTLK